ncbi:hypothetical protein CQ10_37955 [Bradyrhizobium valentinum]|nr:hypothetical protein CQ10_37955 [Bradyrhizobium valentinum]
MVENADLYAGRAYKIDSMIDDSFAKNQVALVNVARLACTAPCGVETSDANVAIFAFDDVGFQKRLVDTQLSELTDQMSL